MDDIIDEDMSGDDKVVTHIDNDIIYYKMESIVSKSLVTNRVKTSLNQLKKTLKTLVTFENKNSDCLVSISGEDRNQVIETNMKLIELLVQSRRLRPFTHLITVPFRSDQLVDRFERFKDIVLNSTDCKDKQIDESLFTKPIKLHLTFCVLVLLNQNEISLAKQLLNESVDQIVKPIVGDRPLKVSVEGLAVMKGQSHKAHVVYAQVSDESNRLQSIADQIVDKFVKSGLLEETRDNKVKLHITFMNSLFRQRFCIKNVDTSVSSKKRIKRETFNAKDIIETYKSHKFDDCLVESIQLNDIKSTTDGYYGLVEAINLDKLYQSMGN